MSLILEIIAEEKCTHAVILPYVLYDMVQQGIPSDVDLSTVKYWCTGGQFLSLSLLRQLLNMLPAETKIIDIYGSTETSDIANEIIDRRGIVKKDELGYMEVNPGCELKIIDQSGQLVPVGEKGD